MQASLPQGLYLELFPFFQHLEVSVTIQGTPVTVEIFTSVSSLSEID